MIELPEVEQMQQIGGSAAIPEQLRVARAARHLCGELVRSQPANRAVERNARPGQAVLPEEGRDGEWILGLRHGMQMPAIELAELLAVFADIEPDMARQARPVGVPFLQTHVSVFETDEDLRVRVGVEGGLKADLELSRIEVVALHPAPGRIAADITRNPDFGIELRLVALPAHRLRQRISGARGVAESAARGLARGRAQRGEIVPDRRGDGGCRRLPAHHAQYAIELGAQLPHLRRQRIHLALRRLLADCRGGAERRREQQHAQRASHVEFPLRCVRNPIAPPHAERVLVRQERNSGGARAGAVRLTAATTKNTRATGAMRTVVAGSARVNACCVTTRALA
ncbi:MAG: hypothetical protein DMD59_09745 [Gemmatimonadetes bacterium]|nr:MAG: hypothetical protein DMD59_09745 [Gemmatimonadota bacterium]